MLNIIISLLEATCYAGIPLVLAAVGGLVSERSGVVNISLEGGILLAAFCSAATAHVFGSSWSGLAIGCLAGSFYMLLYGVSVFIFKVKAVVAGTAFNTMAFGVTLIFSKFLFNNSSQTPMIEMETRFLFFPFVFTSVAILLLYLWEKKTSSGLWVRFAGEQPQALKSSGLNLNIIRWFSMVLSGFLVGAAGSFLSMWLAGFFSKGMSAGRGFMAIAAIVLGGWKIGHTTLACFFFAAAEALQTRLQTSESLISLGIPIQAIQALPYLMTLFAIAILTQSRPPKALS